MKIAEALKYEPIEDYEFESPGFYVRVSFCPEDLKVDAVAGKALQILALLGILDEVDEEDA